MTDKQIIIDGVDVSKCEYHSLNKNNCSLCSLSNNLICSYKPFCYYKQLKAKEQECERLKNERTIDLVKQLDQLKAENEELTTINARLLGRLEVDETDTSLVFNLDKELRQKEKEFYTAIQKVVKLKQTITEIKEIARVNSINTCWTAISLCADCDEIKECGLQSPFEKLKAIIQKISECEGNND